MHGDGACTGMCFPQNPIQLPFSNIAMHRREACYACVLYYLSLDLSGFQLSTTRYSVMVLATQMDLCA
jgi:hypothetical protein